MTAVCSISLMHRTKHPFLPSDIGAFGKQNHAFLKVKRAYWDDVMTKTALYVSIM